MKFVLITTSILIIYSTSFGQQKVDQATVDQAMAKLNEKQSTPIDQLERQNSELRKQVVELQKKLKDQQKIFDQQILDLKNQLPNPALYDAVIKTMTGLVNFAADTSNVGKSLFAKEVITIVQSLSDQQTKDATDFKTSLAALAVVLQQSVDLDDEYQKRLPLGGGLLKYIESEQAKNETALRECLENVEAVMVTVFKKNKGQPATMPTFNF